MAAGRGFRNIACWLAGLIVSFALLLPLPAGRAQDYEVDLALILAIDCSFSVDSREFALQMEGIGSAFMRDEVKKAIAQGQRQRIAVAVVQWSDERNQIVVAAVDDRFRRRGCRRTGPDSDRACRGSWRKAARRFPRHSPSPPRCSPPRPPPSAR